MAHKGEGEESGRFPYFPLPLVGRAGVGGEAAQPYPSAYGGGKGTSGRDYATTSICCSACIAHIRA
jgi:hypothetical protein